MTPIVLTVYNSADVVGSYRMGTVTAAPVALAAFLGEPTRPGGDGTKVDREWVIRTEHGCVTVYAYQATSLYRTDLQTPEEFWARSRACDMSLGGKNELAVSAVIYALSAAGFDARPY